jgi:hypothetical protein
MRVWSSGSTPLNAWPSEESAPVTFARCWTPARVIADYPGDLPYPSRLVLAWLGARPVHVVAADNHDDRITIVITVYEPDSALWETDFRTRRKP